MATSKIFNTSSVMKARFVKLILFCIFILPASIHAQQNLPWDLWLNPVSNDFATIQESVETWYQDRDKGPGTGFKHWKRWEEFNQSRVDINGSTVNVAALNLEAFKKQKHTLPGNNRNVQGDWKPWSASTLVNSGSWAPGIGRINEIAFHPTDPDIIYIGTPAGGIFKTTNHGESWIDLTDTLSSIGVSGIAVHPDSPNTIYILTGDGDGGNSKSIGVYKSTNGGVTWDATGLTWAVDTVLGRKIVLEPGFPSWMLVAANNGLWQSTNNGVTWLMVQAGNFYDVEYKPGNSSIVYASTATTLFKSTNYGQTWTSKNVESTATRTQIAVSPDADSIVYLLRGPTNIVVDNNQMPPDTTNGFRGVYRSFDSGENFSVILETPNVLSGSFTGNDLKNQTTYDLTLAVSPINAYEVFLGGVNVWKYLVNQSIAISGYWALPTPSGAQYVHADIHNLIYNPLNNCLYAATDGGIWYTCDQGTTWTGITDGLNISQLYHFDGTDQDIDFMVGGLQDNGTAIFTENDTMKSVLGADGGDVLIHPQNKNIIYAMTQLGNLLKSTNGGTSFSNISPFQDDDTNPGPFITPWDMDMNRPDTIYVGWSNDTIYRTFNGGTSWTKVKMPGGYNQEVTDVTIAANGSTLFALTCQIVWRSTNYGSTWTKIGTPIFAPGGCYTSIVAHPTNSNKVIITRGGFGPGFDRVIEYNTVGNTFTSILGTGGSPGALPLVPANISVRHDTEPHIYVGTDIGVYFYSENNTNAGWQVFKKGLPNSIVRDIRIYEEHGIMRVATFARGTWQSDVWDDCPYDLVLTPANDPAGGMPGVQFNEAADGIYSNRLITGTMGNVTYKAGDLVLLTTGFLATEGNVVRIGNSPCSIPLN